MRSACFTGAIYRGFRNENVFCFGLSIFYSFSSFRLVWLSPFFYNGFFFLCNAVLAFPVYACFRKKVFEYTLAWDRMTSISGCCSRHCSGCASGPGGVAVCPLHWTPPSTCYSSPGDLSLEPACTFFPKPAHNFNHIQTRIPIERNAALKTTFLLLKMYQACFGMPLFEISSNLIFRGIFAKIHDKIRNYSKIWGNDSTT